MALSFSVPQAAAILMPVLLLMGIPGMAEFRKDFDLKLLKFLIPCGLVGIVVGALPPKWLGAILTITLGFTSFISRAGGPPINAYVIPLRLSPIKFTATSLVLLPIAPIGVLVGVRLARRISHALFYQLLDGGMLLTGVKLIWDTVSNCYY